MNPEPPSTVIFDAVPQKGFSYCGNVKTEQSALGVQSFVGGYHWLTWVSATHWSNITVKKCIYYCRVVYTVKKKDYLSMVVWRLLTLNFSSMLMSS